MASVGPRAGLRRRRRVYGALLALCALVPLISLALGRPYYIDLFERVMVWSMAAVALDLVLGYGAMLSFGHAMFLGVGGYTVAIFAYYDIHSGWVAWPLAILLCGVLGLVVGAISARTRGIHFIMITLALAQMMYYLVVSLEQFGSNDGLPIYEHSRFALPIGGRWRDLIDLGHPLTLYYLIFTLLLLSLWLTARVVRSRFGRVLRGSKSNDARMRALGFDTYAYRVVAFAISGALCGLAGVLMAESELFVSPDMMHWSRSGDLIFMVVLGGMGTLFGPFAGAVVFLLLTDLLAHLTEHYDILFGPFLVLVVLFARGGIDGLLGGRGA